MPSPQENHADATPAPVTIGAPRMSAAELRMLRRVFASGRRRYAEFGTGGSTLLAVEAGFEAIVGVESDAAWARAVREHAAVSPAVAEGRASILHADLGPVGDWGTPRRENARLFPLYVSTMWEEWARREAFPDLVLVDGRFRVACALSVALLAAARPAGAEPPLILVHDYTGQRPQYAPMLRFLDLAERSESLVLLRPRPEASPAGIMAAMLQHLSDRS
jgi:hypothetical protein